MVRTAKTTLIRIALLGAVMLATATGLAQTDGPVKPSKKDKCPVCGMFVAKYPDWVAQVRFTNGQTAYFDGVKDLCKFYFNIGHYRPGRSSAASSGTASRSAPQSSTSAPCWRERTRWSAT